MLRDDIRPQSRAVVEKLRRFGLRTVVLTGDRQATAEHLKHQLLLDEVRAELNPEQKVAAIDLFPLYSSHRLVLRPAIARSKQIFKSLAALGAQFLLVAKTI